MIEAPRRTERLLEKSGRITPREVLEAYEETGLEPSFALWGMLGESACALTALGCAAGVEGEFPSSIGRRYYFDVRRGEQSYANGFIAGFDGTNRQTPRNARNRLGHRDGQRVRKFVLSRYEVQS